MSSLPTGAAVAVRQAQAPQKARGFLHIVRHGAGTNAFYIVSYHQIARTGVRPKPMLAEGAQALIDMLERVGVDFRLREHPRPLAKRRRTPSQRPSRILIRPPAFVGAALAPPSWVALAFVAAAFRGGRLSL